MIINNLKEFKNYDEERDYPYLDKTTKMSAYIKFGCISIREIYYNLPVKHGLIRELFWHDFYAGITYNFPYIFGGSYKKNYDKVKWDNNETFFNKWKEGKTGFPLSLFIINQLLKNLKLLIPMNPFSLQKTLPQNL